VQQRSQPLTQAISGGGVAGHEVLRRRIVLAGEGEMSKSTAARLFGVSLASVQIAKFPTSEYPLPAARPANGVLSSLGGPMLRHWR
jgi:hypothetical protein